MCNNEIYNFYNFYSISLKFLADILYASLATLIVLNRYFGLVNDGKIKVSYENIDKPVK